MKSATAFVLFTLLHLTDSARLTFSDGGNHTITSDQENVNIYVLNSTSLTLASDSSYTVTSPSSTDDGESAIRVENAYLYANGGIIIGAAQIGGPGVTVTTDKDRNSKSFAFFESGVEIVGGSAGRASTTQGGDAVQIIQQGAEATFNGGKFTPGTGCTIDVCGVQTDDGNVMQVLYGKAVIKGGQFEGNINSISGEVEVHGCVEFDGERISGFLLDGSSLDVGYVGQANDLQIIYNETVCEDESNEDSAGSSDTPQNAAEVLYKSITFATVTILGALGYLLA